MERSGNLGATSQFLAADEEAAGQHVNNGEVWNLKKGRRGKERLATDTVRRRVLPSSAKFDTGAGVLRSGKGVQQRGRSPRQLHSKVLDDDYTACHVGGGTRDANRRGLIARPATLLVRRGARSGSWAVGDASVTRCGRRRRRHEAIPGSEGRSHSFGPNEDCGNSGRSLLHGNRDDSDYICSETSEAVSSGGPLMEAGKAGKIPESAVTGGVRETDTESSRMLLVDSKQAVATEDTTVEATLSKKPEASGCPLSDAPELRKHRSDTGADGHVNHGVEEAGSREVAERQAATQERVGGERKSLARSRPQRTSGAVRRSGRRMTRTKALPGSGQMASDPEGKVAASFRRSCFFSEAAEDSEDPDDSCSAAFVRKDGLYSRCEQLRGVTREEENVPGASTQRSERDSCSDRHQSEFTGAWGTLHFSACTPQQSLWRPDDGLSRWGSSPREGAEREHNEDAIAEQTRETRQSWTGGRLPRESKAPSPSSILGRIDVDAGEPTAEERSLPDGSCSTGPRVTRRKSRASLKEEKPRGRCRIRRSSDRLQKKAQDGEADSTGEISRVTETTETGRDGKRPQLLLRGSSGEQGVREERSDSVPGKRDTEKAPRRQKLGRTAKERDGSNDSVHGSLLWGGLVGVVSRIPFEALIPLTCRYLEQANASLYLHHVQARNRERRLHARLQEIAGRIAKLEEEGPACTPRAGPDEARQDAPATLSANSERAPGNIDSFARLGRQTRRTGCKNWRWKHRRERDLGSRASSASQAEPQRQRMAEEVLQKQGETRRERETPSGKDRAADGLPASGCSQQQQHVAEARKLPFVRPVLHQGWDEIIELGTRVLDPAEEHCSPPLSLAKSTGDASSTRNPPLGAPSDQASQETELEESCTFSQPGREQRPSVEVVAGDGFPGAGKKKVFRRTPGEQLSCLEPSSNADRKATALQALFMNTLEARHRAQSRWLSLIEFVCRESTQPVLQLMGLAWVYRQRQVAQGLAKPVSPDCLFTLVRALYVHERQLVRCGRVSYPSLQLAVACLANASVKQLARTRVRPLLAELLQVELASAPSLTFQVHHRQPLSSRVRQGGHLAIELSRRASMLQQPSLHLLHGLFQGGFRTLPDRSAAEAADTSQVLGKCGRAAQMDEDTFPSVTKAGHLAKGSLDLLLTFLGNGGGGGRQCGLSPWDRLRRDAGFSPERGRCERPWHSTAVAELRSRRVEHSRDPLSSFYFRRHSRARFSSDEWLCSSRCFVKQ